MEHGTSLTSNCHCLCVCVCACEGDAVMCVFVHIPVLTHNETGEEGDGDINILKE